MPSLPFVAACLFLLLAANGLCGNGISLHHGAPGLSFANLAHHHPNITRHRSLLALSSVVLCSFAYVRTDPTIRVASNSVGIFWMAVWGSLVFTDLVFGKHITQKLTMSNWERVFYQNAFSLVPILIMFQSQKKPDWAAEMKRCV